MQDNCRHYQRRSTVAGDGIERCRLKMAETEPRFACLDGCLFLEDRSVSQAGWTIDPGEQRR